AESRSAPPIPGTGRGAAPASGTGPSSLRARLPPGAAERAPAPAAPTDPAAALRSPPGAQHPGCALTGLVVPFRTAGCGPVLRWETTVRRHSWDDLGEHRWVPESGPRLLQAPSNTSNTPLPTS
ncbi:hypothetical protein DV515_00007058, partial [Chloebia gouldiae]